jgi:hypothetical protein
LNSPYQETPKKRYNFLMKTRYRIACIFFSFDSFVKSFFYISPPPQQVFVMFELPLIRNALKCPFPCFFSWLSDMRRFKKNLMPLGSASASGYWINTTHNSQQEREWQEASGPKKGHQPPVLSAAIRLPIHHTTYHLRATRPARCSLLIVNVL